MAEIEIGDIRWHYVCEGERGPWMVFLHGWGADLRVWRQQVRAFQGEYRIVCVDLPGHGETSWQAVSFEELGRGVWDLLRRLSADRVHLVGSSMGGLVALQMYSLAPERVASLVLTGSAPRLCRTTGYPFGLGEQRVLKLTEALKKNYPRSVGRFFVSLFSRAERESLVYRWLRRFKSSEGFASVEVLAHFFVLLQTADFRPMLPAITAPVLVINGDLDIVCPPGVMDVFRAGVPSARCEIFKDCGHFPFLVYARAFNDALEVFLRDSTGGSEGCGDGR